jgi:hypothetical protein
VASQGAAKFDRALIRYDACCHSIQLASPNNLKPQSGVGYEKILFVDWGYLLAILAKILFIDDGDRRC